MQYEVGDKIEMEIKNISIIKKGKKMVYLENKEIFDGLGGASFIIRKEKENDFIVSFPNKMIKTEKEE